MAYISLNIGSNNIKVLSLNGRRVKKWGSLALQDGLVKDGLIMEPEALGEAISSLFESTGIPRDGIVTSLAGLSCPYRFIKLPRLKPSDREEAIRRTASREMALPVDDLYLTWKALPATGDEQDLFVLGVPKNLVDTMLQALGAAKVTPRYFDLRPLALARAAAKSDAIIINLDADCFDIVFVAGGIPAVIHTIGPRSNEATLDDNIRQVVDELGKMAAFYQSSRPEVPLNPETPLLVAGDLAGDSTAAALLQAEVEYSVAPLEFPVDSPPGFPSATYAISIGLALKKATPPKPAKGKGALFRDLDVDILAGKRRQQARHLPAFYLPLVLFLIMALVLLFPLYQTRAQLTAENEALQNELNETSRELNLAELAAEKTAAVEATILKITANTSDQRAANLALLSPRGDYSNILEVVTQTLPPDTILTSIDCDVRQVSAAGLTSTVFVALDYAVSLKTTGYFSDVRITRLDEVNPTVTEDDTTEPIYPIIFEIILER